MALPEPSEATRASCAATNWPVTRRYLGIFRVSAFAVVTVIGSTVGSGFEAGAGAGALWQAVRAQVSAIKRYR
jgi:hypothetical protein